MKTLIDPQRAAQPRHGGMLLLAAAALLIVLGCTAFAVDLGYITLAKSQLQSAADAAALSAALDFDFQADQGDVEAAVRDGAVELAGLHRAAGFDSVLLDSAADVQVGQAVLNPTSQLFEANFTSGSTPLNLVKVTARLKQFDLTSDGTTVDRRVPLFFARLFGQNTAEMEVTATAAVLPGVGFRVETNSSKRAKVLPFALDELTWLALLNGVGPDQYSYNPETGAVSTASDGILEADLYPNGSTSLPPGNRGTVDFGDSGNSTNDIKRQIMDGLNADDLSVFGGELRTDLGALSINGDTGISAGFKEELAAIKGEPRAIPLFTQVSGPGNNAVYTIVRFVGVRIVAVKLTGNPKYVKIQPAHFIDSTVIPGDVTVITLGPGTIMTAPRLIN